jgi:cytochrome c oxidase subunit 2
MWAALIAIALVASAIGIALGLAIRWFPVQGSTIAHKIDTFWDVLIIVSVPIFVGVTTMVLFSIWRWHQRPGEELLDGPPIHGNTKLEIVWTAIPTLIIAGLCAYATVLLLDIQNAPAKGTHVVEVTGQQFAWTFATVENGKKIQTNELYVPVGQPVSFKVKSLDVIHDFWVPQWRLKVDAVPGITTGYTLTPSRTGTFQVVCAELCGIGHAFMRQYVHILPRAQYAAWVQKLTGSAGVGAAGAAGTGAASAADVGKQIYVAGVPATGTLACGTCHTMKAAGTVSSTGPNLDKMLAHDPASAIKDSIVNPNSEIVPGYPKGLMPANYAKTLSSQQLDALVAYIYKSVHRR